ncbi:MAG: hypothetical protein CSA22_01740 [Deltaproteobacteria bacterium]|nr:MAG: hypothetical protein CSA22_01740 [Deltaproteobacteria bacterium]
MYITERWRLREILLTLMLFLLSMPAMAGDSIGVYGLNGYGYTGDPVPVEGVYLQIGGMISTYHENNLKCRDGHIMAVPLSISAGNGTHWQLAAATHWERWKNTDFDNDEDGFGDLFVGGSYQMLHADAGHLLDLSLGAHLLVPTGDRDKAIGDLFLFNATDTDDTVAGVNLRIGKSWGDLRLTADLGANKVHAKDEALKDNSWTFGAAAAYTVSDHLTVYTEVFNHHHRNRETPSSDSSCYDPDRKDDIREIALGAFWSQKNWGFKTQIGAGISETSPDMRVMASVNHAFDF